jgi:hypothetical protein
MRASRDLIGIPSSRYQRGNWTSLDAHRHAVRLGNE